MPLLCAYRDILGKPGQGFHRARLFGLARNDLLGTLAIAVAVALLLAYSRSYDWQTTVKAGCVLFFALALLGFVLHLLFCVKTPLTRPFLIELGV
jgi:phosphoglycerol transferase MdoB-like AlkP superfamily enzyme